MKYWIRKLRKFIYKLSPTVLKYCTCISVFLALLGRLGIEKLKEIPVYGIGDWAVTVDSLIDIQINGAAYPVIRVCIYSAACVFTLLSICKYLMHPKAVVLKHSAFSNALSGYDDTLLNGYTVQEFDVDLVKQMKDQNIETAISRQDRIIKKIKASCDEYTELFYYGIAHIPLIFRAGFQIGDEGKTRLLHKYRNGTGQFKEISTENDEFIRCLDPQKKVYNNNSKEMLMVVATSFPVSNQDLEAFHQNNIRCELRLEMRDKTMYGVDAIESYGQMERLRSPIMSEMRDMVSQYSIERIHLVLSTSSDFTFYLAEGFSEHHDPEIIVYQYERNSDVKYPWGISNIAPPEDAVFCVS